MRGIASSRVTPPLYQRQVLRSASLRSETQPHHRDRHATFCRAGISRGPSGRHRRRLGIAKGSIFQHFGSKDGLFFEVYKKRCPLIRQYLDAPGEVRAAGFFEVLRYWLVRTEHLVHEDWIPYRISLLGNYGTDLALKREINRFLMSEDPYGTVAFVRFGLERGELRKDIDMEMIVSIIDWMMERFQDALLTEELDPGLFRRQGELAEKKEAQNPSVSGRPAAGHRKRRCGAQHSGASAPESSPIALEFIRVAVASGVEFRSLIRDINMQTSIEQILAIYNDRAPLSEASTIPAPWYVDPRIAELERLNVFSKTWQLVARTEQLQKPGQFVATRASRRADRCCSRNRRGSCALSTMCAATTPRTW